MKIPETEYSPWDLLPVKEPKTVNPPDDYFYKNVIKHLIPDVVRIMANGIPIDLAKVRELEATLDEVLNKVDKAVQNNTYIKQFQILQYTELQKLYIAEQRSKMKLPKHFLKEFKISNITHRSYFMEEVYKDILKHKSKDDNLPAKPKEKLVTGITKWTLADAKRLITIHPAIQLLVTKRITLTNKFVKDAMKQLAKDKATIYNKRYYNNIENSNELALPPFNIASSIQKRKLFDWLGIPSEKTSKETGLPSWDRDEIERINKETNDLKIKELTSSFIDYSFGAIVKNNFIKSFYLYTINNRLYGTMKLFGAKSFRLTSNNPNLLNMPSTKSIYSKPVKKCFIAPPGTVILAIDYGALEDRVIASLTRDENKCNIFLKGLDGHCLNAYGYFKEEIAQHMPITGDIETDVKEFYRLVEDGHMVLKAIRQKGKPITFGLSYGAYPPKVASSMKISLAAATAIFDSYHNELYPGIKKYREKYILPTAKKNGRIHLGMGCYISTDKASKDIRTLNNATCQFWSILTLLTINKMHKLIDIAHLEKEIQCISSIYDSIYFTVKDDPKIIKWVNDNVVALMTQDWMENQTIKNTAIAEIGLDWATMHQISNGAKIPEIEDVLTKLRDTST